MKRFLTAAMLGMFTMAVVGCEASGEIDADDDRDTSYKKTTKVDEDGDRTVTTEKKTTVDRD